MQQGKVTNPDTVNSETLPLLREVVSHPNANLLLIQSDLASIVSVSQLLRAAFTPKDCYRLGKFNPESNKPKLILVQFVRAVDVTNILAKKGKLAQPLH